MIKKIMGIISIICMVAVGTGIGYLAYVGIRTLCQVKMFVV